MKNILTTIIEGRSKHPRLWILQIFILLFRFDSTKIRGHFNTKIGVGMVIRGNHPSILDSTAVLLTSGLIHSRLGWGGSANVIGREEYLDHLKVNK
jgi:hypothetical protein